MGAFQVTALSWLLFGLNTPSRLNPDQLMFTGRKFWFGRLTVRFTDQIDRATRNCVSYADENSGCNFKNHHPFGASDGDQPCLFA